MQYLCFYNVDNLQPKNDSQKPITHNPQNHARKPKTYNQQPTTNNPQTHDQQPKTHNQSPPPNNKTTKQFCRLMENAYLCTD